MYIEIGYKYKLKDGAKPVSGGINSGITWTGRDKLMLMAVDPSDGTVLMQPEYSTENGAFWCNPKDLLEDA